MKSISSFKFPARFKTGWALAMAVCFGLMTLFAPVLHNHDWDPFHAESDCAPCNWSQSNVSLEVQAPDTSVFSQVLIWELPVHGTAPARSNNTRKSRSPPTSV